MKLRALSIQKVERIVVLKSFYLWLSGLVIPAFYFYLLLSFKNCVKFFAKKGWNIFIILFFIYLFVQIISFAISPFNDFFSPSRFIAAFRNAMCAIFIFYGYYFCARNEFTIEKFIKNLFLIVSILSIVSFLVSFLLQRELGYPGVLAIISGVENLQTTVNFTHNGFILNFTVPRARVFGLYPNTTAILLLIIYSIFFFKVGRKSFFHDALLVLSVLSTGARLPLFIAFLLIIMSYVQSWKSFSLLLIIAVLNITNIGDLLSRVADSRAGSNNSRSTLYLKSIELTNRTNPIFGIGSKPKLAEVVGGTLPVGSHSALIGSYVKHGIVAFAIIFFLFFYIFFVSFLNTILGLSKYFRGYGLKKNFLFSLWCLPLISIAFLSEDFDAYELIPFFFGILLFFYTRNLRVKFI